MGKGGKGASRAEKTSTRDYNKSPIAKGKGEFSQSKRDYDRREKQPKEATKTESHGRKTCKKRHTWKNNTVGGRGDRIMGETGKKNSSERREHNDRAISDPTQECFKTSDSLKLPEGGECPVRLDNTRAFKPQEKKNFSRGLGM